jgi:hypothetical protein
MAYLKHREEMLNDAEIFWLDETIPSPKNRRLNGL